MRKEELTKEEQEQRGLNKEEQEARETQERRPRRGE